MRAYQFVLGILAALAMVTAVGGCGGKKKGPSRNEVWLKKPLEPKTETLKGTAFEIHLPAGMKLHDRQSFRLGWIPEGGDQFDSPQVTVSKSVMWHPTSPEDAVKKHKADELNKSDVILKSTSAAGGVLMVYHHFEKQGVTAKLFLTRGKIQLHARCDWSRPVEADGAVDDFDKVTAWVEKVCLTFKLK